MLRSAERRAPIIALIKSLAFCKKDLVGAVSAVWAIISLTAATNASSLVLPSFLAAKNAACASSKTPKSVASLNTPSFCPLIFLVSANIPLGPRMPSTPT